MKKFLLNKYAFIVVSSLLLITILASILEKIAQ